MIICLDFDGVLHDAANPLPLRRMGPPMPGALDAVRELLRHGHMLVIHTARIPAGDDTRAKHIYDWLVYYDFPLIPVGVGKPMADVYLDDKGLRHEDWETSLNALAALSSELVRKRIKPRAVPKYRPVGPRRH